jgi:hypothetical protein
MGLLSARQAEMAEAVVSCSRLRSRIAMIDSLALAQEVPNTFEGESSARRRQGAQGCAQEHVRREKARWLANRDHPDVFTEELEQALQIIAVLQVPEPSTLRMGCGFTHAPVVDGTIMATENHWDPRFDIERSTAGNG